jgi:hypothetical protein
VRNRLDELGLSLDKLIEVVEAMVGASAECTDNDPPGARGWSSWRMGTRRLREEMRSEPGWEKDEGDQISSILNASMGIRIAVSNTDDGTQVDEHGRFPQNRSRKGAATDRAVNTNQQTFINILDESMNVVPIAPRASREIVTWYLCTYSGGDVVRAELSCPVGLEDGFFTGFVERIFLIDPRDDGGPAVRRSTGGDDDGSEFDIPVTRKPST